jgi:hypothetical protein
MMIELDGIRVEDLGGVQGRSSASNHNMLAIPGEQYRSSRCALSQQYWKLRPNRQGQISRCPAEHLTKCDG